MPSQDRRYTHSLSDLLDRLTISQLKEVKIPEHRAVYTQEIADIIHDIDLILAEEKPVIDANFLRAVIIIAQYNELIWSNEANWRKGIREGNNLELTHGLNGIRNHCKNIVVGYTSGRKDYKLDNVEAFQQWVPSI